MYASAFQPAFAKDFMKDTQPIKYMRRVIKLTAKLTQTQK